MKKIILNAIIILFPTLIFAQQGKYKVTVEKDKSGIIMSVQYPLMDKTIKTPSNAETFFRDSLKIKKEDIFKKQMHKSKRKDLVHEHFDQYYKGILVDEAGFNFHYKDGRMFYSHGHYIQIQNLDVKPTITSDNAKELFCKYKKIPSS